MTRLTGGALRLTVFVGENDTWRHRPLYSEIVHRAHAAGIAGASVFRGVEGFGASSLIHTSRLLSLSEDLPVAVVIVDTPERVEAFLPQLDELVTDGLVVLDECRVLGRTRRGSGADGDGDADGVGGADGDGGGRRGGRPDDSGMKGKNSL
ncbi:PII-like signaling protein [Streptomyces achromogenes]|uniref:DUF190 domain-containing protein n=1 Tax=Streptomyces achromogenes TaxID=67255 RepID=UPI00277D2BD1|nr:DUF190 domain-containing protein [Streptomyces achromogenes]MDQ0828931.1 PII-like signaling protein [Streptomyces achromogenes]